MIDPTVLISTLTMRLEFLKVKTITYSEKQLKGINIILTLLQLKKKTQTKYFFAFNISTNLHIIKKQNEIYESLVTIQYHAKCNNPFYQNFTSNKICFIFCCKHDLVIASFLIPTTEKFSLPFTSHCTQNVQIWHTRSKMIIYWH